MNLKKISHHKMNQAVCINCGFACSSIYKQFSKDIIKLTTCVRSFFMNLYSNSPYFKKENCGELVDEYAETEFSIIVIDMLLLKKAALRHVLYNSNLQGAWKLIVLFILCDAYEKTSQKHFSKSSMKHGDYIIDLELNFYLMCIKSLLGSQLNISLMV